MANPRNLADIAPLVTESSNNVAFSNTVNLSGGTANGVLYLDGSKVATSGSALVFDGTSLGVGSASAGPRIQARGAINNEALISSIRTDSGVETAMGSDGGLTAGFVRTVSNHPLVFGVNNSEQMRLTSTGLGIGTSSPGTNILRLQQKTAGNTYGLRIDNPDITAGVNMYVTAGASGYFGIGVGATDDLVLNKSGNLGLGVTPSAWGTSSQKAIQVQPVLALSSRGAGNTDSAVTHNAYYDGTNWRYIDSSVGAARYQMTGANAGSTHSWSVAAGGTAGNTISFTQAMTLDASGRLGVGSTETGYGFVNINRYSSAPLATLTLGDFATASNSVGIYIRSSSTAGISWASGGALTFNGGGPGNDERARITSGGDLLVGSSNSNSVSSAFYKSVGGLGTTPVRIAAFGVAGTNDVSFNGQWRWYTSTGNGSILKEGYNLILRNYDDGSVAESTNLVTISGRGVISAKSYVISDRGLKYGTNIFNGVTRKAVFCAAGVSSQTFRLGYIARHYWGSGPVYMTIYRTYYSGFKRSIYAILGDSKVGDGAASFTIHTETDGGDVSTPFIDTYVTISGDDQYASIKITVPPYAGYSVEFECIGITVEDSDNPPAQTNTIVIHDNPISV